MIVLIPVDVMKVAVMAALAPVIFAEKLWRYGKAFAQAVGVVLVAVGVLAIWIPWMLPGRAHLWHAGDATQATQNATHGGLRCQESVLYRPGDPVIGPGLGCCAGFPRSCWFRAGARPRVKLERPQPLAPVRALARTNELDAGKGRPMIASEESLPGLWLAVGGGSLRCWPPVVGARARRSGSHIHPFGRPRGRGP
jgi:hypothetical protein